jgi:autotransporter-like protein
VSSSKLVFRIAFGLAAIAAVFFVDPSPAEAQLSAGCTCPGAGTPNGVNTCFVLGFGTVPATCSARNLGIAGIAASQQQLSFSGVQSILQGRRDQLQGTLGASKPVSTSTVSGYAASDFDETFGALGYANPRSNSFAYYKASPAPAAPASTGPSWAVWVQGVGDWEHRDAASATDFAHFTSTYAVQAGADATWRGLAVADDALVVGLVASRTDTHVSYDNTATKTRMYGPGVGIYGTYVRGGFSADLTTKFDFLQLTNDFGSVTPPPISVGLTNAGVSGNIQYKQDLGHDSFLEPTGGFSFTKTMFGSGAEAAGLADSATLRLQAGARLGATWTVNGVSVEPSLKALAYSDVMVEGGTTATAVAASVSPTDVGKVRGEVDPALNLDFGKGYSAALSGQVRFGEGLLGGSVNLNLRKQW